MLNFLLVWQNNKWILKYYKIKIVNDIDIYIHTHIYTYTYIYIWSICRDLTSLRAHQYNSDQITILKDQSAQTTARVVSIAYCLWLPFLMNRVLNWTKLRSIIYCISYILNLFLECVKSSQYEGKVFIYNIWTNKLNRHLGNWKIYVYSQSSGCANMNQIPNTDFTCKLYVASEIRGTLLWNQKHLMASGSHDSALFNCDVASLIWCCSVWKFLWSRPSRSHFCC